MSTDDLRDLIDEKITTNGEQEITGAILNNVLQEAVDTLADGENLDEGSIKTANIADGAITTDKIADGNVKTDKIEDHAVTKDKLEQNVSSDLDWAVASNSYYRNSQAGDVAAKVITTYKNMSLIGGGSLKVTFEQANTADDATLNIDGKGAKPLYYNGKRVSSTNSWEANETVEIYYNNYNSGIYYAKRWMVEPVSVSQNTLIIGGEEKSALPDNYIESTEWASVITDIARRVLEGTTIDLKKIFLLKTIFEKDTIFKKDITIKGLIRGKKGATIEKELELDGEIFKVVSSDEWSIALIDKSGRVAIGIRKNGKLVVYGGIEIHNENLPNGLKEIKYTEVLNGTFNYASTFINWQKCYLFPISVGKIYKITNSINQEVNYAILKDNTPALSDVFHCKSLMDKDAEVYVPADGAYLYVDCAYIDYIKVYETEKTYDIDKSNIKNRLIYSINKSLRYTFNVVIPNRYPGFDTITNFGGNTEVYIRPMAQVCFTLGTQIYNKTYDALSTGHSIYDAKKQLVRLVNSIANYYIYWGHQWQSALWAYYIGVGCILNRDLFTDEEFEQVVHCIETEADFQVANTDLTTLYWMDNNDQPYYNAGDTKLEEVDWNNAVVGLAALVTTDDEKRQAYKSKFVELCCIGQSMPGDYQSGKVVNGYPLSELQGYNVRADGVAINNGIVHPGYSLDAYCSLFGTVACMMYLGKLVPKAVWFNQDKITHALTNRDFTQAEGYNPPYGTIYKAGTNDIYYPQGHDWGLVLGITQASADIICNLLGLHPDEDWETWGNLHLNRVLRFQDRNESGKYYEDGENYLAPEYYENETYEPTKLCVALAFILNPLFEDDSDWYNVE